MKKIYMILAAMTLLSMSLNAQFDATKKVAQAQQTTQTKKAITFPVSYKAALSSTPSRPRTAPNRATENVTDHITASALAATGTTYTNFSDVTFTSDAVYAGNSARNNGTNIQLRATNPSGIVTTTSGGKVKSITITVASGTNTVRVYGKNTAYTSAADLYSTSSATQGTLLGSTSTSGTITVTGDYEYIGIRSQRNTVYLSSIDVVWEKEIEDGNTDDLTVCDGQYYAQYLPVFGYYHDEAQHNQMVYPASILGSSMTGKAIKSMTFYPTTGSVTWNNGTTESASGINFRNGTVCFKLANIPSGSGSFDADNPSFVNATLTEVKTVNMPSSANTSATTWVITFDQEFVYTGGDLLIDVTNPTTGDWGLTFFTVDDTGDNYYGYLTSGAGNAALNYLPKVTFTYELPSGPQHDLEIDLDAPASVGAGNTATLTATVTNNGDYDESGYTVTFYANGTAISTQTGGLLEIGEDQTFTFDYTTTAAQGGTTVNFSATVTCTDDAVAANDEATASTSVITLPPPINVVAVPDDNQNATVTWNAPNIPQNTVTEGFDNTAVFTPFSIGGITASVHTGTIGGWTVYTPSSNSVYAYNNASFDNAYQPQAWTVFNTSMSGSYDTHSGNQVMLSFCDAGTGNGQGILTTDHWLISPELSGGAQTITFWERVITDQYGAETFEVLASSNDNNPASFSNVQTYSSTSTGWGSHTVTLPAGTKYFAIHHTSYDIFGLMIDDVTYIAPSLQPTSYNVYLDGQLMGSVNASDPLSYDFSNLAVGNHTVEISAVYPLGESALVPYTFTIKDKTATPTLSMVNNGDGTYTITATATSPDTDAEVTLNVTGQQTVTGTGSASITITQTNVDQNVTATATALATDKLVSDEASANYTIPALPQTPAPTIAISSTTDNEVTITATGNGSVILNIPGYEPATGNGSASITVPRHMSDYVVTATATAQASGELVSTTTTQNITVPGKGNDGWTEMTGTYNNPNDLLSFKVKVGNDTTDIMMIDQFLQSTVFNDHPSSYTYVLKETKVINGVDSTMTSNPATIPVYKTNSTMRGLYTEAQVLADDYADEANRLTANAVNGEIDYDVVPDNNVLYYSLYRGGIQEQTPVVDVDHRISQLQKFEDKVGDNVTYYLTENHPTGILPRYDHEDNIGSQTVERLDVDYVTGVTGDQMSYVPVIWTFGLYTARGDGKNNSYGSDIKYNELGGVDVSSDIIVNWSDNNKMKVNGVDYYVVSPVITLDAVAPELGASNDGETYKYVPYMYRVWCTYTDAHSFGHVVNPDGINYSLVETGLIDAPFLIGEVKADTISDDPTHIVIGRDLGHVSPQTQWSFAVTKEAALNNDIKFVVRYYYKKVVTEAGADQPAGMRGNRDGGADYAIYEKSTSSSDIITGVNELWSGYGKVVISQTYVNAQGMQSDKPFDGLNIVVTRYSDGTTTTTKVVR